MDPGARVHKAVGGNFRNSADRVDPKADSRVAPAVATVVHEETRAVGLIALRHRRHHCLTSMPPSSRKKEVSIFLRAKLR